MTIIVLKRTDGTMVAVNPDQIRSFGPKFDDAMKLTRSWIDTGAVGGDLVVLTEFHALVLLLAKVRIEETTATGELVQMPVTSE